MNAQEIRDLFKRHNVPLSREDVWDVHGGTPVIKHQALERLSSILKVSWSQPIILRSERDEAVIVVTGNLPGGASEWSIGEAVIGQNYMIRGKMAAYPYAMAEKRAKDRVILKLAGLYGSHSEEEADDFKQGPRGEYIEGPPQKPDPIEGYHPPGGRPSKSVYIEKSIKRMDDFAYTFELLEWAKTEREKVWPQYGIEAHDLFGQQFVMAYKDRMAVLEKTDKTEAA